MKEHQGSKCLPPTRDQSGGVTRSQVITRLSNTIPHSKHVNVPTSIKPPKETNGFPDPQPGVLIYVNLIDI